MTDTDTAAPATRSFEADVAKLLQLMVHSVYSDKDVFLRELISNAADACEKLRYEGLSDAALLGEGDGSPASPLRSTPDARRLTIEDNGIGMSEAELGEALGTIARSGTKAFMDRIAGAKDAEGSQLIGQFGVGFYSAFMVGSTRRRDVSRRADVRQRGDVVVGRARHLHDPGRADVADAPARGTRVMLHLKEDAADLYRGLHRRAHDQGAVGACAGADLPQGQARRRRPGRSPTARRCGRGPRPTSRRGIHRLLPQRRRTVRRAGADAALSRRGAARIYGAGLHPRDQAVRPVRPRPHRPDEALCPPRVHHRRGARSCRAICASCAGWSTRTICRSTCRAR